MLGYVMTKDNLLRSVVVDVLALFLATTRREAWSTLTEEDRARLKNEAAEMMVHWGGEGTDYYQDNTNALFRIFEFLLRHLPDCDAHNENHPLVSCLIEYLTTWSDNDIRASDHSSEATTIRRQKLAEYCRAIINQLPHNEKELPIVRAVRQWTTENPPPAHPHPRDVTMLRFHTALEDLAILAHGIRPRAY